ncbi:hypothetical protein ACFPYJ_32925 [Paenibacillus solisilvae]|uniref:Uncharacterized protein n=1 Tax=Paenibacillus solisilvae TaxID=2486751 RepID=A0ABW0W6P7_9BACL
MDRSPLHKPVDDSPVSLYMGTIRAFKEAGFSTVVTRGDSKVLMRYEI